MKAGKETNASIKSTTAICSKKVSDTVISLLRLFMKTRIASAFPAIEKIPVNEKIKQSLGIQSEVHHSHSTQQ